MKREKENWQRENENWNREKEHLKKLNENLKQENGEMKNKIEENSKKVRSFNIYFIWIVFDSKDFPNHWYINFFLFLKMILKIHKNKEWTS